LINHRGKGGGQKGIEVQANRYKASKSVQAASKKVWKNLLPVEKTNGGAAKSMCKDRHACEPLRHRTC